MASANRALRSRDDGVVKRVTRLVVVAFDMILSDGDV
jgi:hypothetical protein